MQTLTKHDLTLELQDALGVTVPTAAKMTEALVKIVKTAIFSRKLIYIPKLMRIISTLKAARPGRNPKTLEDVTITARYSIRASKTAKGAEYGKLTKREFTDRLTEYGYTKVLSDEIRNIFYKYISQIADGTKRVEIRGLGVFSTRTYKAGRMCRNPNTGTKVVKSAQIIPSFKCSSSLRKAMDKAYL